MTFLRAVNRFAVAAATVASVALAMPAAQASSTAGGTSIAGQPSPEGEVGTYDAPYGRRCGAYRDATHLWYKHCADNWIMVEVDKIVGDNKFACVGPREDIVLDSILFSDNAWYAGPGNLC